MGKTIAKSVLDGRNTKRQVVETRKHQKNVLGVQFDWCAGCSVNRNVKK